MGRIRSDKSPQIIPSSIVSDKILSGLAIRPLQTNRFDTSEPILGIATDAYRVPSMSGQSPIELPSLVELSLIGRLISALATEKIDLPIGFDGIRSENVAVNQSLLLAKASATQLRPLAEQLKSRLQTVISSSGVFYESHLKQWMIGEKTQVEIAREPQAQHLDMDEQPSAELMQIVKQQLAVLENQELNWFGNLGTGIPMQWRIVRQDTQNARSNEGAPLDPSEKSDWFSELRIEFPHLGLVTIALKLCDKHISLAMKGNRVVSVDLLQSKFDALNTALLASETTISAFSVEYDEKK